VSSRVETLLRETIRSRRFIPNRTGPKRSASSVFAILQAILGLYPFALTHVLLLDPQLPDWLPELFVRNLHVGRAVVSIRFYREGTATHFEVLEKRGR